MGVFVESTVAFYGILFYIGQSDKLFLTHVFDPEDSNFSTEEISNLVVSPTLSK